MIKLHPRMKIVNKAANELTGYVDHLQSHYKITDWELIGILLDTAQEVKRFALRSERHPNDPEKKADEL